jgi:lysozyme family protein
MKLSDDLRKEYESLFLTCRVRDGELPWNERQSWRDEVEDTVTNILRGGKRYAAVGEPLGIPWYVVGILHSRESSSNFTRHLSNGDPLSARTVNVPAGRPIKGTPPFTWEEGAVDALAFDGLDRNEDWSVAGTLFVFESYNGFGYRRRRINSPYLWSFSQHFSAGKFVADGKFSTTAVDKQVGAAVLLRRMIDQSLLGDAPTPKCVGLK